MNGTQAGARIVKLTTCDGLRLEASFAKPASGKDIAFLGIHGTGDSFLRPSIFDQLTESLLERGFPVMRLNTRGHGVVSNISTSRGVIEVGSAHEKIEDCRYDISAALDWLKLKGYINVVLVGHSLGALKAVYYSAHEDDSRVRACVGLSPPRFSYNWIMENGNREAFRRQLKRAKHLIRKGYGNQLINVRYPLRYTNSARAYYDKYSSEEKYNILGLIPMLSRPGLLIWGEKEAEKISIFRDLAEDVGALGSEWIDTKIIPAGNHYYTEVREKAVREINNWLDTLDEPSAVA